MEPMSDQLQSPLFSRLSAEIRVKIYEFYLEDLRWSSGGVRYWQFSKRPELAFLIMPVRGAIPALVYACRRIRAELAPSIFDHISLTARQIGWSIRVGVGVFGDLDLARKRRLTIINHHPTTVYDWLSFFRHMTSEAARAGWFESVCAWENVKTENVPVASQLEELVLDWATKDAERDRLFGDKSDGDSREETAETRENDETSRLLRHIASLKTLKTVRFRGDYPKWWKDFLQRHATSPLRIICE